MTREIITYNGIAFAGRRKRHSRWYAFLVELFLPLTVATSASLGSVYFVLQHAALFGSSIVVAPILLPIAGMIANWLLYKRPIPNTFKQIYHLYLDIKEDKWSRDNVYRIVGFIYTLTYAGMIGVIVYASVSSMLKFYALQLLTLLGISGVVVSPIGIGIATVFFLTVVVTTTVCLLFNDFDATVRLLLNKERLDQAWVSFTKHFRQNSDKHSKINYFKVVIFSLLLILALYFAVVSTLTMLGIASHIVIAAAPKLSVFITFLTLFFALPSRLPFALKGLVKLSLFMIDLLFNPSAHLYKFLRELQQRKLCIKRALHNKHGLEAFKLSISLRFQYYIWPLIKAVMVLINAVGSFCMGKTGSQSEPVRQVITFNHLLNLSDIQISYISGTVVFVKDSSTVGFEAYHEDKTLGFWHKCRTIFGSDSQALRLVKQHEEQQALQSKLRSRSSNILQKLQVSQWLLASRSEARWVLGNYGRALETLPEYVTNPIEYVVQLQMLQCLAMKLSQQQLFEAIEKLLVNLDKVGSEHYRLTKVTIEILLGQVTNKERVQYFLNKSHNKNEVNVDEILQLTSFAETQPDIRTSTKLLKQLASNESTTECAEKCLVAVDMMLPSLEQFPEKLSTVTLRLLENCSWQSAIQFIENLGRHQKNIPQKFVTLLVQRSLLENQVEGIAELFSNLSMLDEDIFDQLLEESGNSSNRAAILDAIAAIPANILNEKQRQARLLFFLTNFTQKINDERACVSGSAALLVKVMQTEEVVLCPFYIEPLLRRMRSVDHAIVVDAIDSVIALMPLFNQLENSLFQQLVALVFSEEPDIRAKVLRTVLMLLHQVARDGCEEVLNDVQQAEIRDAIKSLVEREECQLTSIEFDLLNDMIDCLEEDDAKTLKLELVGKSIKRKDTLLVDVMASTIFQQFIAERNIPNNVEVVRRFLLEFRSHSQRKEYFLVAYSLIESEIIAGSNEFLTIKNILLKTLNDSNNSPVVQTAINLAVFMELKYPGLFSMENITSIEGGKDIRVLQHAISSVKDKQSSDIVCYNQAIKELNFYLRKSRQDSWKLFSWFGFFAVGENRFMHQDGAIPHTFLAIRQVVENLIRKYGSSEELQEKNLDASLHENELKDVTTALAECRRLLRQSSQKIMRKINRHGDTQQVLNECAEFMASNNCALLQPSAA